MLEALTGREEYVGTWISFEDLRTAPPEVFWARMGMQLGRQARKVLPDFGLPSMDGVWGLEDFAVALKQRVRRKWVLIIDEFDGTPDYALGELMHHFRRLYHQKAEHALHSVALVGVRNITEVNLDKASPFNIVDEIQIPYFTAKEVRGLINQYAGETGQSFQSEVVRQVHSNTAGQPGLVCALCRDLVERFAADRSEPVNMDAFWPLLEYYLIERLDKNISNIVSKARQEQAMMLKVLFNGEVPFRIDNPAICFLHVHGVVGNVDGVVDVPVPLYKKRLISAFQPLINGEIEHYTTVQTDFSMFFDGDRLSMEALLGNYREYVRRRGFRAFDTEHLKEGAWHYSLDGYIHFFVQRLGGRSFVEVPTGRGRTDILIVWQDHTYIIETKVYTDNYAYQKGKHQLAEYLKSEGPDEGYYVVFSNKHTDEDTLFEDETIEGKRILTYVIQTNPLPATGSR